MHLTRKQIQQIDAILLDAFDRASLGRMVYVRLGERLESISHGETLHDVTLNLIAWAAQQERIDELVEGIYSERSNRQDVQELRRDVETWQIASTSNITPAQVLSSDLAARTWLTEPEPSIDVFLCYSHENSLHMRAVNRVLRSKGLSVWTSESILAGTPKWRTAIEGAIQKAPAFVVLLSPEAVESKWVSNEIAYAEARNKKIFPVIIAGNVEASVPIDLINLNWVDGRKELDRAVDQELWPALVEFLKLEEQRDISAQRPDHPKISDNVLSVLRDPVWQSVAVIVTILLFALPLILSPTLALFATALFVLFAVLFMYAVKIEPDSQTGAGLISIVAQILLGSALGAVATWLTNVLFGPVPTILLSVMGTGIVAYIASFPKLKDYRIFLIALIAGCVILVGLVANTSIARPEIIGPHLS